MIWTAVAGGAVTRLKEFTDDQFVAKVVIKHIWAAVYKAVL